MTVFWGANWAALKIALAEIPVWQYRAITCGVSGIALLALAALGGIAIRVPRGYVPRLALAALFNVTGWQILSAYGVHLIPSGKASVLAFTMPVWATLLSVLFLGERLTARIIGALALGLAAIAVLLSADFGALRSAPLGTLLTIGAAISWAIGTVIQKRLQWPMPVIAVAAWQLAIGSLPIVTIALLTESIRVQDASAAALWALGYSLVLPMIFCTYAWYKVVSLFPASIAAIGTIMVPAVGLVMGAVLLHEPLGWREITALLCVAGAIALVFLQPRGAAAASRY